MGKKKTPRRSRKTRARFEDLAFLGQTGCTTQEAADRLGVPLNTLEKTVDRHAAWPLWRKLQANERERFGGLTMAQLRHLANAGNKMTTAA